MCLSLSTLEARKYVWEAKRERKFYPLACQHLGGTHLEGALRSRANTAAAAAATNANSEEGKAARGEHLTATHHNTGGMIMMMMMMCVGGG